MPVKNIDDYIEKAPEYARPILNHLRELVHKACPEVEEKIKWGAPHFDYKGMYCGMAAFKNHCAFSFWKGSLLSDPEKIISTSPEHGMGNFGKIISMKDLPKDKIILAYLKEAMKLNDEGVKPYSPKKKVKEELEVPAELEKALKKNKVAQTIFNEGSYSFRKEYIEWINDAKTEATKTKRLETALEWIGEGKGRHWKYQKK